MFHTSCRKPCRAQAENEIWSAVSSDGIKWRHHERLISNRLGPAEPAAIISPHRNGGFWKVYYTERNEAATVRMAYVDTMRRVVDIKDVYRHRGHAISGVSVARFAGKWHLFFNVFYGNPLDRVDVYKTESYGNELFRREAFPIVVNDGAVICTATTPAVLPIHGDEYYLYFGLSLRERNGDCYLDKHVGIHRWRLRD